jgi:alkaline phosphatase D
MTTRPDPTTITLANRLRAAGASRRAVLRAAMALAAGAFAPGLAAQAPPRPRIRFTGDPFTLGVASGYPRPDRVSLWTRLAPAPLEPAGGMPVERVDVEWEVASDERFAQVVARGRVRAVPDTAHSVHAEATGLAPGRWYHYRFRSGDAVSPTGRTRTADAPDADVRRLKLAIGSCQHFEQGWFSAYRHLADENLDLMLFLGDYIYEAGWGDDLVRRHATGTAFTLPAYRVLHAQYKTDPDLQRLHGQVPWLLAWDDHEVDNDYAADRSEHLDPAFLARRAAGYQAYFEHMALPRELWPHGPDMRLYAHADFGRLARIAMLDDRQYRSPQACPDPYKRGGSTDVIPADCPEVLDPSRTLLGREQEAWLEARLAESGRTWNVIGQQTLMARFPTPREGGGESVWTDGWDGYPHAREQVLAALERHRVPNPVVLGGDLHATVVADIHRTEDPRSPIVASEFVGTSISAQGSDRVTNPARLARNPHVHFADATRRGYVTCEFTPRRLDVAERVLDTVKSPTSRVETRNRFVVEAGRPGVKRA